MTSLPAVLFDGGSQTIVEGSVVWLYCQVNSTSPTLTVTWNKDSVPMILDVPHIRIRNENDTSDGKFISVLIVDNFQTVDNGTYQCTAQEGVDAAMGTPLTLTGIAYNSARGKKIPPPPPLISHHPLFSICSNCWVTSNTLQQ